MTPAEYLAVNERFDRPFVYDLTTTRGFFSVVGVLLNAVTYSLLEKRRLVVSERHFDGLSWSDFFNFGWPPASSDAETLGIDHFNAYALAKHRRWLPLRTPSVTGNLRTIQRSIASIVATPRFRASPLSVPYAAIHIRRGDKTLGYMDGDRFIVEGEATPPKAYLSILQRKAPSIKTIFVLTDDYTAVEELRKAAPHLTIETLCDPSERGFHQFSAQPIDVEQRRQSIRRLLREVDIAAQSEIFLGGFKSNVARYVALIHQTPRNCFSVDGNQRWKPI